MVAVQVTATPNVARAVAAHRGAHSIGVALFNHGKAALPGLGANLAQAVRRGLPQSPAPVAWDCLSIALAAFAADRFVSRSEAEDGWTRVIGLEVAVQHPALWTPQATRLAAALRFLTGDIWHLSFTGDGGEPPVFPPKLTDRDAVCLFSGGLDSLLGALELLERGRRPLLVSQGSPKEITPQKYLARMIGLDGHRFDGRVHEIWRAPYEGSTRGRSLIFFAYGVLAASALGLNEVIVPENGLIAINPPLTRRRLSSLSTRTTHPHFLSELGGVLDAVGLRIRLSNIFEGMTKGEMLASCRHPKRQALAAASYSCGKGKRRNGQCGRCIPCLIRRSAFHAAGLPDQTKAYFVDIRDARKHDDVVAARLAVARLPNCIDSKFERWVAAAGPLPTDATRRANIVRAVHKGLTEVSDFLDSIRWR
jgi:hypothetical protein